jgi:ABC-2 type transport system permease protein
MAWQQILVAYGTITRKECTRFLRIWTQTLLPSVMTMVLYYVIFGSFIGSQIAPIAGFSYMQFIVPGLVMMAVITNSFSNVVSSFYGSKFQRNLEELMVSPTPHWVVIAGYVTGGALRGLLIGGLVLATSLFFTHLVVKHVFLTVVFILLTSVLFSLAGLLNGIFAKSFDGVSIIPTFVLTPLTYLGGVFYSVSALPHFWQQVSKLNPILYMVNGFRYGLLGISDVSVGMSLGILFIMSLALLCANLYIFYRGYGLKS